MFGQRFASLYGAHPCVASYRHPRSRTHSFEHRLTDAQTQRSDPRLQRPDICPIALRGGCILAPPAGLCVHTPAHDSTVHWSYGSRSSSPHDATQVTAMHRDAPIRDAASDVIPGADPDNPHVRSAPTEHVVRPVAAPAVFIGRSISRHIGHVQYISRDM